MSLPMPTIAAVNGHVSATGYLPAIVHDYVFMRKDRGFLYFSELDCGVVLTATYIRAVLGAKISESFCLARRGSESREDDRRESLENGDSSSRAWRTVGEEKLERASVCKK